MFRRVSSSRSSSRTSNCRPPSRCPLRAPSAPHSDGRKLRHFCTVCAWAMYIKPHHRSIFFAHGVATLALFIALAAFYRNSPGVSAFYQLAINLVIFALCVRFRRLLNYTTFRSIRSSARSRWTRSLWARRPSSKRSEIKDQTGKSMITVSACSRRCRTSRFCRPQPSGARGSARLVSSSLSLLNSGSPKRPECYQWNGMNIFRAFGARQQKSGTKEHVRNGKLQATSRPWRRCSCTIRCTCHRVSCGMNESGMFAKLFWSE